MPQLEPTHGDILVQIGELKGQVQTMITLIGEKRADINAAFSRIGQLEKFSATHAEVSQVESRTRALEGVVAKWAGICMAASFSFPFVFAYAQQFIPVHTRPEAERLAPERHQPAEPRR
jgi:hypothetical protein